jgi:DNA-binding NarL/FixJ family response regulator
MLTTYDEDDYVSRAVAHGAVGYLLKDMPPDTLITSLRSALDGQFQIPQRLIRSVMSAPTEPEDPGSGELPEWLYDLSRKERTILRLIIEGQNNDEIALAVHLAPQTVKNYISRMYAKADVDSRVHLIRVARNYVQYLW